MILVVLCDVKIRNLGNDEGYGVGEKGFGVGDWKGWF